MEPEGSLPFSQKPATVPYPEAAESSLPIFSTPYFFKIHLIFFELIILIILD